jgi:hypothetical protein
MREPNEHYDGANPDEPLRADHFSPAERRDAQQLGDGSPGVSAREDVEADEFAADNDGQESMSDDRRETP